MKLFLLGMLFFGYILPLMDAGSTFLQSLIKLWYTRVSLKIAKVEAEIKVVEATDTTTSPRVIGFTAPAEEEDETEL